EKVHRGVLEKFQLECRERFVQTRLNNTRAGILTCGCGNVLLGANGGGERCHHTKRYFRNFSDGCTFSRESSGSDTSTSSIGSTGRCKPNSTVPRRRP